jgi:hypothetical protein
VWQRINARVKLELAQQPQPQPAPNNEPPPAGNTITAAESAAIDLALAIMMQQVEAAVVPPPDNVKKPTQTEADWQTNVVYWTVYRSPGSAWVKSNHPPAPVKIPAQSPWIAVWQRINARVKLELAQQQPQPQPQPAPNNQPPQGALTSAEKSTADLALAFSVQEVDASVVAPPDNKKKVGQTEADWQTNVVYWGGLSQPRL